MGLSGGSKSTSGSAQKWATPYAKAAASDVQDVYNTNQGTAQSTANTITSLVPSSPAAIRASQALPIRRVIICLMC